MSTPIFSRKPQAFTLVELLVVISIVTLLISILLPTIERSREVSRKQLCANNLRQMNFASEAYAAERQGRINRSVYQGHLNQYIEETKYHRKGCPSWGQEEIENATGWQGRSIGINTIIAGAWSWGTRILKSEHIKKPFRTGHLADSAGVQFGDGNLVTTESYTVLRGRHKEEGLNFVFYDGHGQFLRPGGIVNATNPWLPAADWRNFPGSCAGPGNATGPFSCVNKGCFWHPY